MPKRNGHNPIRMDKHPKQGLGNSNKPATGHDHQSGSIQCPACKTDVAPKPGFRMRSLKCPKCGASLRK